METSVSCRRNDGGETASTLGQRQENVVIAERTFGDLQWLQFGARGGAHARQSRALPGTEAKDIERSNLKERKCLFNCNPFHPPYFSSPSSARLMVFLHILHLLTLTHIHTLAPPVQNKPIARQECFHRRRILMLPNDPATKVTVLPSQGESLSAGRRARSVIRWTHA